MWLANATAHKTVASLTRGLSWQLCMAVLAVTYLSVPSAQDLHRTIQGQNQTCKQRHSVGLRCMRGVDAGWRRCYLTQKSPQCTMSVDPPSR